MPGILTTLGAITGGAILLSLFDWVFSSRPSNPPTHPTQPPRYDATPSRLTQPEVPAIRAYQYQPGRQVDESYPSYLEIQPQVAYSPQQPQQQRYPYQSYQPVQPSPVQRRPLQEVTQRRGQDQVDVSQSDRTLQLRSDYEISQLTGDELRALANKHGDMMSENYENITLSRHHKAEMERLHRKASDKIFAENNVNKGLRPNEVDLHRLLVKEAEERAEEHIIIAKQRGDKDIRLIVGQGRHTKDGVPKIKPAIEKLVTGMRLPVKCLDSNPGVLIVRLNGQEFEDKQTSPSKMRTWRNMRRHSSVNPSSPTKDNFASLVL